jgi:hypothetical protein
MTQLTITPWNLSGNLSVIFQLNFAISDQSMQSCHPKTHC